MTEKGTVILLGSYFRDQKRPGEQSIQLLLTADGWQRLEDTVEMPSETPKLDCPIKSAFPAPQELTQWVDDSRWASDAYFQQELVGCVQFGDDFWAGTAWYGGEGYWGIGGLIRFDGLKQEAHARYLWGLQEHSVSHLELFDEQLWIGTTHNGECSGPAPGFGVKRYPLVEGKRTSYREENIGWTIPSPGYRAWDEHRICGFAVRDMLVNNGDLWIATELGLSVVQKRDDELVFVNYVPDLASEALLREVTCDELYAELLASPRSVTDEALNVGFVFDDLWVKLSAYRWDFVSRYLRRLHGHEAPNDVD